MTSRDFCYWLQGFFEIEDESNQPEKVSLNPKQVEMIKRHLSLVFKHEIDPSFGKNQKGLNAIHNKPLVRC